MHQRGQKIIGKWRAVISAEWLYLCMNNEGKIHCELIWLMLQFKHQKCSLMTLKSGFHVILTSFCFCALLWPTCVVFLMLGLMSSTHLKFSSKAREFSVHFVRAHTVIYSRYRNTGGADDTTYENGFFFFFERNCNLEKQKLNSQTPRFTFFILPVSQPAVSFSFQASCAPRDTNQRNMLYIQRDVMGYRCCCSSHQNVPSLLITTPSWMKQYRETICGKMLPWSLDGDNVYIVPNLPMGTCKGEDMCQHFFLR